MQFLDFVKVMLKSFVLPRANKLILLLSLGFGWGATGFAQTNIPAKTEPGLVVTFTTPEGGQAKAADVVTAPNVWLYVPAGKPATPFLPGGKFEATWEGFINAERRADYQFQAELSGGLKLEINGAVALAATGNGAATELGKPVRLNRGLNVFKASFTSPTNGDAFVRLEWKPKDSFVQLIPTDALARAAEAPNLAQAEKLHQGRALFVDYRCVKCHAGPAPESGMLELTMDAPAFAGIGTRRNYEWLARWIADPKALRPTAHMPQVLHGPKAKAEAEAIAAYLASLELKSAKGAAGTLLNVEYEGSSGPANTTLAENSSLAAGGRELAETLHCAACHNLPGATEMDAAKIPLLHVREKFADGALIGFLMKPDAHYAWIRMPNFKLSEDEANRLAAYLLAAADKPKSASATQDVAVLERGKKLVQTSGCLNCHVLKLENQFATKRLADLTGANWKQGCLAAAHGETSKAPNFNFTAEEREALAAFGATDRASLMRQVPAEFAERQTHELNCRECHGKFDGFPSFDILGGKLRPEWSRAFIDGEIKWKPRPWLEARMPAFALPQRAEGIAQGLAMSHGYPPQTPVEPAIDAEAAKVGQKLISMVGGFSCVSCHAVGEFGATQVFDSAGINFARTGSRLMKPYVERWVRNPQSVDPTTKMPVYFDETGKSPLGDVYGGDGAKQIDAIWEYIRLGDKMPPPPTP